MKWALLTTGKSLNPSLWQPKSIAHLTCWVIGPYMEMMHFFWAPKYDATTSTFVFAAPLADGAVPMIHLDDLGEYARWIFDHADQSAGKDLRVATQHVHFNEAAEAFTKVTGNKAIYQDIPLEAWFDNFVKEGASSAYQVDASEAGVLTFRESFTGWWNCYRHSGGENPFISIDYDLLDKVIFLTVTNFVKFLFD